MPLRNDSMKETLHTSLQKALGLSWKLSLHWTRNSWSFFGSVLLKVSGSWTFAQEALDSSGCQCVERERQLMVWARVMKGSSLSEGGSWLSLSSSLGSLGSSGPSGPLPL